MTPAEKAAQAFWNAQPHPLEPNLSIGDFALAVQLATKVKFGGHASPKEAHLFWEEFKQLQMGPQEFEHLVDRVAPVAFAFHGRPPTMLELARFKESQPAEVSRYFGDLPDRHYPHVSAASMVKALTAARPFARALLGREPLKYEAATLHHSGEKPDSYYARLAEDRAQKGQSAPDGQAKLASVGNGVQTATGPDPRGRDLGPVGRQALNQ